MEQRLVKTDYSQINYQKSWEKTLLYKFSFGKAVPSESWKKQLERVYDKQMLKTSEEYIRDYNRYR
tara:strand:+ start:1251 stop:1448 length:198 start_codon:yes stop_codon:yes gene_type:complete